MERRIDVGEEAGVACRHQDPRIELRYVMTYT
jgi:hypothetical protein